MWRDLLACPRRGFRVAHVSPVGRVEAFGRFDGGLVVRATDIGYCFLVVAYRTCGGEILLQITRLKVHEFHRIQTQESDSSDWIAYQSKSTFKVIRSNARMTHTCL